MVEKAEPKIEQHRDYQTHFGDGFANLRMVIPKTYIKEDIQDLRAWLKLIDKQLERLEEKAD